MLGEEAGGLPQATSTGSTIEMTEEEIRLKRRISGQVGLSEPIRQWKARFAGRKCYSCFPDGAPFSIITAEFESHLGMSAVISVGPPIRGQVAAICPTRKAPSSTCGMS
jgi:hypothetical protein